MVRYLLEKILKQVVETLKSLDFNIVQKLIKLFELSHTNKTLHILVGELNYNAHDLSENHCITIVSSEEVESKEFLRFVAL